MNITEMGMGGGMSGSPKDLSKQRGNATSELQANYDQLMTIQDPDEMIQAALGVVQPLVGKGVSEKNWDNFQRELTNSARKGLNGVIQYITMYIVKGSGMGIARGGEGRHGRYESIETVASIITEDADIFHDLTPYQQYLKNLVENHTNLKLVLI